MLENLQKKPYDIKVRSLPKSNKAVKDKILAYDDACAFLQLVDFDTYVDPINLVNYHPARIQQGIDAINNHMDILNGVKKEKASFKNEKPN